MQETIQRRILEARGATMLTIAHRLNTVIAADRILVMDKGLLAENGTPKVSFLAITCTLPCQQTKHPAAAKTNRRPGERSCGTLSSAVDKSRGGGGAGVSGWGGELVMCREATSVMS